MLIFYEDVRCHHIFMKKNCYFEHLHACGHDKNSPKNEIVHLKYIKIHRTINYNIYLQITRPLHRLIKPLWRS